jgi:hypothetical protein
MLLQSLAISFVINEVLAIWIPCVTSIFSLPSFPPVIHPTTTTATAYFSTCNLQLTEVTAMPGQAGLLHLVAFVDFFSYKRVVEIFELPASFNGQILDHVATQKDWPSVDKNVETRYLRYVQVVRETSAPQLLPLTRDNLFQKEHGRVIGEWQKIWNKLLKACKFNKKFDDFLFEARIDYTHKISRWNQQIARNVNVPQPTPGGLHHEERIWIAEWLFGTKAYMEDDGSPVRVVKDDIYRISGVFYEASWQRKKRAHNRLMGALDKMLTEIETIWDREFY